MLEISAKDIANRMRRDNPWWEGHADRIPEDRYPRRDYFDPFHHLVTRNDVQRAVVLMGPRRVGKTVMAKQSIQALLRDGVPMDAVFFASLDTPTLIGKPLESLLQTYLETVGGERAQRWVFFDEVQYLKDWEVHLKSLVDSYPDIKFVVTGSAASVLKRKSEESGAGRFTDFILPPLTFAEFLRFRDIDRDSPTDALNAAFQKYLAFGGYPEIVVNPSLEASLDQYLRSDIIDKVLLRDLPALYGVTDLQEMHRLFSTLVYNTGQEVSLEKLSRNSGVSKTTLKKYLEYFEGAFLVRRLSRVDDTASDFKRERTFKVYVANPTLYCALFGTLEPDDPKMGHLVETAVLAQAMNGFGQSRFRYARWSGGKGGEVDLVVIDPRTQKASGAMEIKWSNRISKDVHVADSLVDFALKTMPANPKAWVSTRSYSATLQVRGVQILCVPSAEICLRYATHALDDMKSRLGLPIKNPEAG